MKRHQGWAGVALLCCGGVQAEVGVEVPRDFQILAVSAGKGAGRAARRVLADGEQQLLVRYGGDPESQQQRQRSPGSLRAPGASL